MGYRIEYPPIRKLRRQEKRTCSRAALTGICLLLFLLLVNGLWPRGAEVLRELLLPADAAVTAAALEDLAVELKAGEAVSSALTSLCRKLFQGALGG